MKVLVDSSTWIDHLRAQNPAMKALLEHRRVVTHPFVIGELEMGTMPRRNDFFRFLDDLQKVRVAKDSTVRETVNERSLYGRGIGYLDAHLLVAARLNEGVLLWTRDRRLRQAAEELSLAYPLPS